MIKLQLKHRQNQSWVEVQLEFLTRLIALVRLLTEVLMTIQRRVDAKSPDKNEADGPNEI